MSQEESKGRTLSVSDLIERLSQADVDPKWPVYLNPYGENLDLEQVQVDDEYIVLVTS